MCRFQPTGSSGSKLPPVYNVMWTVKPPKGLSSSASRDLMSTNPGRLELEMNSNLHAYSVSFNSCKFPQLQHVAAQANATVHTFQRSTPPAVRPRPPPRAYMYTLPMCHTLTWHCTISLVRRCDWHWPLQLLDQVVHVQFEIECHDIQTMWHCQWQYWHDQYNWLLSHMWENVENESNIIKAYVDIICR